MDKRLAKISAFANDMRRFRLPALGVAWFLTNVGVVVVHLVPDKFKATASRFLDTQSVWKSPKSGLVIRPNIEQQATILSRKLASRPSIEKLVRITDVDLCNELKAHQEALNAALMNTIEIENLGRDNLNLFSYRDNGPGRAKRVSQLLVRQQMARGLNAAQPIGPSVSA